jgi:hypothetical protein
MWSFDTCMHCAMFKSGQTFIISLWHYCLSSPHTATAPKNFSLLSNHNLVLINQSSPSFLPGSTLPLVARRIPWKRLWGKGPAVSGHATGILLCIFCRYKSGKNYYFSKIINPDPQDSTLWTCHVQSTLKWKHVLPVNWTNRYNANFISPKLTKALYGIL